MILLVKKKLKIIYFAYRLIWPKPQKINIYKERAPKILLIFQTKILIAVLYILRKYIKDILLVSNYIISNIKERITIITVVMILIRFPPTKYCGLKFISQVS